MKKVWILLLLAAITIICFLYFTGQPPGRRVEVLISGDGKITKESVEILRDLQSLRVKRRDSPLVEFHVELLIDINDETIEKAIESNIKRELLNFTDVKVEPVELLNKLRTSEKDIIEYSLRVKASEEKYKTGVKTGRIVLAAVYTQKMSSKEQRQVLHERVEAILEDSTPIYESSIKSHLSKVFPEEILDIITN